jgi:hypothetical protein
MSNFINIEKYPGRTKLGCMMGKKGDKENTSNIELLVSNVV